MKQRRSYPKDISIIAAIFIIAILLIAAMNLFVSFELRREYFKSEQDKILSIIKLFTNNMETIIDQVELHRQNKIIMRIFNIEHLIITDTLKNMIYDSWPTPLSVSIKPVDYDILFKRLPGSDELLQNGDNLLYRSSGPAYLVYLQYGSQYAMITRVFTWHIIYMTILLIFVSFLGIFLVRNLLLPMRYVARTAKEFGIEMKKEDFVSETFQEVFNKIRSRENALVEFSAYIAHEFRNSLATITGLARLVEKGKRKAEDITQECRSMEGLISAILEYSRPLRPVLTMIDLPQMINDAIAKVSIPPQIVIEKSMEKGCSLKADYDLLVIAMSNLIKNGIEAIEGEGFIRIDAHREDEYVLLTVEDTGCGIDKSDVDKVFNPFYSKKETGIGLGLAYVKKIVELHEGKIQVETKKGGGTKMIVKLPGS